MGKIYINSAIQSIDDALREQFEEHVCSAIEESDIVVVSKKSIKPEDIHALSDDGKRHVVLLVDDSDKDLIKAAKEVGAEIFYSPVKIPVLGKKIEELLYQETEPKQGELSGAKGDTQPKTENAQKTAHSAAYTEKDLTALMQQIKSRMAGTGELEQLRKENEELKEKLKRYEDFISVLSDIFNHAAKE